MLHRIVSLLGPQIEWVLVPMTQMEQRLRIEELSRAQKKVFESSPPLTNTHWDSWRLARNSSVWLNGFYGPRKGDFKSSEAAPSGKPSAAMNKHKGKGPLRGQVPPQGQNAFGIPRSSVDRPSSIADGVKNGLISMETQVNTPEGQKIPVSKLSTRDLMMLCDSDPSGMKRKLHMEKERLMASSQENGVEAALEVIRMQERILKEYVENAKKTGNESDEFETEEEGRFSWADDSDHPENLLPSTDDSEGKPSKEQSPTESEINEFKGKKLHQERLIGKKTKKGELIIEE